MGNGQTTNSSISSQLKNNIVNESTINNLNKSVMNSATNTLINNAQACSTTTAAENSCKIRAGRVVARGAGSRSAVSVDQANKVEVNFSCVNESSSASDMQSSMKETIKNELKAVSDSDLQNKLSAKAASSSEQGFGANLPGAGAPQVNTNVNTNIENNVTNRFNQNIENILEKNFSNNFSSNTVSECINKKTVSNRANIDADGLEAEEGGVAELTCNQSNSVKEVTSCKALSTAINKSVDGVLKDLGIQTVKEDKTKASSESDASAESKNVSTGPIQDMGKAVAGVVDSIGNAAGNIMGGAIMGAMAPSLIVLCLCCCCCIISIVIVMMSSSSSSSQPTISDLPSETIPTPDSSMISETIPSIQSYDIQPS